MSVPVTVPTQPSAVAEKAVNPQEYAMQIQARYAEERNKRVKNEGLAQYINLIKSDKFKHYAEDPWIDRREPGKRPPTDTCKVLILGAGYGALLFAVRMVQNGLDPKDILFVDSAGGFGGTWYWNRYPGLMCDVESYIYMPLLEETGYMPKHKYAYGRELREHAERIATKWNLIDQLVPSSTIKESVWDEGSNVWRTTIHLDRFSEATTISSDFIFLASGVLNTPKIPNIPGIDTFKGHIFHTARWDYAYCGGSPDDPTLSNLGDKKVAIIGTGATAIQVVPALARVASHLTVFQRTPSSVDERGQRPTDPVEWRTKIAARPGWQYERMHNYSAHLSNVPDKPAENLVDDGWTHFPSYSALVGGPACADLTVETIGAHIGTMHALDLPRQERIRARVDAIVEDRETAEKLKPWYAGWCKRPCFHDDYLPSFNRPNVSLVDTVGKGVDAFTNKGVVFDGKEYEADLVVMSTGFNSPAVGNPASKAGVKVAGKNGMTMDAKWDAGVATLHGVCTKGLPNCFFPGPTQAGYSANQVCTLDVVSSHVAHIIGRTMKEAGKEGKVVIEPSEEGEMGWTYRIMPQAISYAILMGCTPSYLNSEGEADREKSMEEKTKGARAAGWSRGLLDYEKVLKKWEGQEKMEGLVVQVKA